MGDEKQGYSPFPWADLMAFGFGRLTLSSGDFWSLTLPELRAAMRSHGLGQTAAMQREELARLMAAHPDTEPRQDKNGETVRERE